MATPAGKSAAPPRVPAGARNLSHINLSEDFLDMGSANHAISSPFIPRVCAIIHPVTGKEIEYVDLWKKITLTPLWEIGMGFTDNVS
jgi:hypothetical protein